MTGGKTKSTSSPSMLPVNRGKISCISGKIYRIKGLFYPCYISKGGGGVQSSCIKCSLANLTFSVDAINDWPLTCWKREMIILEKNTLETSSTAP